MIELRFPIKAMGAVRMTQRGKFVNKRAIAYMNYKKAIQIMARNQYKGKVIDAPIEVVCKFYFQPPKSYSKKKMKMIKHENYKFVKRPDIDNLFKGVTDALNGFIYKDDASITKAMMTKEYDDTDHILIIIKEVQQGNDN